MKHSTVTFIISSMIAGLTISVSGRAAPSVPDPWPDQAYRVEWEEPHIPAEAAPKLKIAIPVTLRNNGNRVWPESEVFVAYHWFRDGRLVVWDGERTPFPHDLRVGGRAALSVRVTTPAEPGSYVLMLTLVHEHVTWFEHKGAATLVRSIAVIPPTQSVDSSVFTRWTTTP